MAELQQLRVMDHLLRDQITVLLQHRPPESDSTVLELDVTHRHFYYYGAQMKLKYVIYVPTTSLFIQKYVFITLHHTSCVLIDFVHLSLMYFFFK